MQTLKVFFYTLCALAAVAALAFFANGLGYSIFKTFAPLNEQVRYNTFENSQSARDGAIRDLNQFQSDFMHAQSDAQRESIASMVVHQFQVYDRTKLPPDLQAFYSQMQAQQ
jgi:hypothetical protein